MASVRISDHLPLVSLPSAMAKNQAYSTVDVNELALYSEVMDVPMEQSQQKSSPDYETVMIMSENTAEIPVTDAYPVGFKENIAYEANPADLKENIASETHLNPMDLQGNIAYETSKKITPQSNDLWSVYKQKRC